MLSATDLWYHASFFAPRAEDMQAFTSYGDAMAWLPAPR